MFHVCAKYSDSLAQTVEKPRIDCMNVRFFFYFFFFFSYVASVRSSRSSCADKICLFLKFCHRISIKWNFEGWVIPQKCKKQRKPGKMSAKSMIWLTFFQDLQEKVSRDWISTEFDTDSDTADVIFLKITIFLHPLTAHTASNYHVCSGHDLSILTDGVCLQSAGAASLMITPYVIAFR